MKSILCMWRGWLGVCLKLEHEGLKVSMVQQIMGEFVFCRWRFWIMCVCVVGVFCAIWSGAKHTEAGESHRWKPENVSKLEPKVQLLECCSYNITLKKKRKKPHVVLGKSQPHNDFLLDIFILHLKIHIFFHILKLYVLLPVAKPIMVKYVTQI